MAEITGSVTVTGIIAPTDTNDTYPVIDPRYGVDGLRNVDTLSDRNSIPSARRRLGMIVGVGVSGPAGTYYKLINEPGTEGTTDSDWNIFSVGGEITFKANGATGLTSGNTIDLVPGTNMTITLTESPTGTARYVLDAAGGSGIGVYESALDPSVEVPVTIGGIEAGTTAGALDGSTFSNLFDLLLFPVIAPTYSAPSLSTSISPSGIHEVGVGYSGTVTPTWTQRDAGDPILYSIDEDVNDGSTVTPNVIASGATGPSASPHSFTDTTPKTHTVDTTVGYATGPTKNDSRGNPDPTGKINAGTITSNTVTVKTIYPYFYGKVSSSTSPGSFTASDITGGQKVLAESSGTITIVFNTASSEKGWFAVPKGAGGTQIVATYSSWYVNAVNNGSIGSSSDLFNAPVQVSGVSPSGTATAIVYDLYMFEYGSQSTDPMQLRS